MNKYLLFLSSDGLRVFLCIYQSFGVFQFAVFIFINFFNLINILVWIVV